MLDIKHFHPKSSLMHFPLPPPLEVTTILIFCHNRLVLLVLEFNVNGII